MKKFFSIACVVIAVTALSACTKKYITPNNNRTVFSNSIPQANWVRTHDGKADSTSISVPALDQYFNERGGVLVYLSFFEGTNGNNTYEQIPEVYNGTSYSYYHYKGNIVLYAQPSNGSTPTVKPPAGIVAKIVLIESD
ncbi:MAG: hypothetical protein JWQ09_5456 [Segetibacter sp.]|nr:hypothetical protein [Segetibacter sp.]